MNKINDNFEFINKLNTSIVKNTVYNNTTRDGTPNQLDISLYDTYRDILNIAMPLKSFNNKTFDKKLFKDLDSSLKQHNTTPATKNMIYLASGIAALSYASYSILRNLNNITPRLFTSPFRRGQSVKHTTVVSTPVNLFENSSRLMASALLIRDLAISHPMNIVVQKVSDEFASSITNMIVENEYLQELETKIQNNDSLIAKIHYQLREKELNVVELKKELHDSMNKRINDANSYNTYINEWKNDYYEADSKLKQAYSQINALKKLNKYYAEEVNKLKNTSLIKTENISQYTQTIIRNRHDGLDISDIERILTNPKLSNEFVIDRLKYSPLNNDYSAKISWLDYIPSFSSIITALGGTIFGQLFRNKAIDQKLEDQDTFIFHLRNLLTRVDIEKNQMSSYIDRLHNEHMFKGYDRGPFDSKAVTKNTRNLLQLIDEHKKQITHLTDSTIDLANINDKTNRDLNFYHAESFVRKYFKELRFISEKMNAGYSDFYPLLFRETANIYKGYYDFDILLHDHEYPGFIFFMELLRELDPFNVLSSSNNMAEFIEFLQSNKPRNWVITNDAAKETYNWYDKRLDEMKIAAQTPDFMTQMLYSVFFMSNKTGLAAALAVLRGYMKHEHGMSEDSINNIINNVLNAVFHTNDLDSVEKTRKYKDMLKDLSTNKDLSNRTFSHILGSIKTLVK